jgi:hypothetical protein
MYHDDTSIDVKSGTRKPKAMKGPWASAQATDRIRYIARHQKMCLTYTGHAREQMADRDLLVSDLLHVLKYGFVFDQADTATRKGFHKYKVVNATPNSGTREIRVVVIPDMKALHLKIVTIMWVD